MGKLFYSYRDGEVYILHKCCPLELLMEEQAGGDGLLMYASKELFEMSSTWTGRRAGSPLGLSRKPANR